MSRLLDAGAVIAAVLGWLVGVALIAFLVIGGMFYRTACPSEVSWTFNPLPFIQSVDVDTARGEAVACRTDTATGYYLGEIPVIGDPLRSVVKSFTGQP